MATARLHLPPAALTGSHASITGDAHRHLTRVLRLTVGDAVTVFDGAGTEIAATITASDGQATTLALGARRTMAPVARPIVLLQAIPKGERMDWLVQKATELGVARIVPVLTSRGVVQPGAGKLKRWHTIAAEAARQSGRADLPHVDGPQPFAAALAAVDASYARLLLWEEDRTRPLRSALTGAEPGAALLVGPEGGFTAAEADAAQTAGFTAVGLGPRILRSETAGLVAVTLAQAALGGLD